MKKNATKERTANDTLRKDVVAAEQLLVLQKKRLATMLRRLGEEAAHGWVLREIDITGEELKLVGVTLHPEHIGELSATIAEEMRGLGWDVEPPAQKAQFNDTKGRPWEFELVLRNTPVNVAEGGATVRAPRRRSPSIPEPPTRPFDKAKSLLVKTGAEDSQ